MRGEYLRGRGVLIEVISISRGVTRQRNSLEQHYIRFTYIIPEIAHRAGSACRRRASLPFVSPGLTHLGFHSRAAAKSPAKTHRVSDVIIPPIEVTVALNGRQHVDSCQPRKRPIEPNASVITEPGLPLGSTIDRASFRSAVSLRSSHSHFEIPSGRKRTLRRFAGSHISRATIPPH